MRIKYFLVMFLTTLLLMDCVIAANLAMEERAMEERAMEERAMEEKEEEALQAKKAAGEKIITPAEGKAPISGFAGWTGFTKTPGAPGGAGLFQKKIAPTPIEEEIVPKLAPSRIAPIGTKRVPTAPDIKPFLEKQGTVKIVPKTQGDFAEQIKQGAERMQEKSKATVTPTEEQIVSKKAPSSVAPIGTKRAPKAPDITPFLEKQSAVKKIEPTEGDFAEQIKQGAQRMQEKIKTTEEEKQKTDKAKGEVKTSVEGKTSQSKPLMLADKPLSYWLEQKDLEAKKTGEEGKVKIKKEEELGAKEKTVVEKKEEPVTKPKEQEELGTKEKTEKQATIGHGGAEHKEKEKEEKGHAPSAGGGGMGGGVMMGGGGSSEMPEEQPTDGTGAAVPAPAPAPTSAPGSEPTSAPTGTETGEQPEGQPGEQPEQELPVQAQPTVATLKDFFMNIGPSIKKMIDDVDYEKENVEIAQELDIQGTVIKFGVGYNLGFAGSGFDDLDNPVEKGFQPAVAIFFPQTIMGISTQALVNAVLKIAAATVDKTLKTGDTMPFVQVVSQILRAPGDMVFCIKLLLLLNTLRRDTTRDMASKLDYLSSETNLLMARLVYTVDEDLTKEAVSKARAEARSKNKKFDPATVKPIYYKGPTAVVRRFLKLFKLEKLADAHDPSCIKIDIPERDYWDWKMHAGKPASILAKAVGGVRLTKEFDKRTQAGEEQLLPLITNKLDYFDRELLWTNFATQAAELEPGLQQLEHVADTTDELLPIEAHEAGLVYAQDFKKLLTDALELMTKTEVFKAGKPLTQDQPEQPDYLTLMAGLIKYIDQEIAGLEAIIKLETVESTEEEGTEDEKNNKDKDIREGIAPEEGVSHENMAPEEISFDAMGPSETGPGDIRVVSSVEKPKVPEKVQPKRVLPIKPLKKPELSDASISIKTKIRIALLDFIDIQYYKFAKNFTYQFYGDPNYVYSDFRLGDIGTLKMAFAIGFRMQRDLGRAAKLYAATPEGAADYQSLTSEAMEALKAAQVQYKTALAVLQQNPAPEQKTALNSARMALLTAKKDFVIKQLQFKAKALMFSFPRVVDLTGNAVVTESVMTFLHREMVALFMRTKHYDTFEKMMNEFLKPLGITLKDLSSGVEADAQKDEELEMENLVGDANDLFVADEQSVEVPEVGVEGNPKVSPEATTGQGGLKHVEEITF